MAGSLRHIRAFNRVTRMLLILSVIDSYRPMKVPLRVMSRISKMSKWKIQRTAKELTDMGIIKAEKGPQGGFTRVKEASMFDLLVFADSAEPPFEMDSNVPVDIKNYVTYCFDRLKKLKV